MEFEVLGRLTDRRGWNSLEVARDVGGDVAAPECEHQGGVFVS